MSIRAARLTIANDRKSFSGVTILAIPEGASIVISNEPSVGYVLTFVDERKIGKGSQQVLAFCDVDQALQAPLSEPKKGRKRK